PGTALLECVVNISEGRDSGVLASLVAAGSPYVLDVHRDWDHNRSVLTLAGGPPALEAAVRSLAAAAVSALDVRLHQGAHPRLGVVDVVPWVALEGWPLRDVPLEAARRHAGGARDRFATWAGEQLGVPAFCYGPAPPERSLPELRAGAWREFRPDAGPEQPHPSAGAVCTGWRPLMVAYNLWLAEPDLALAKSIAAALRGPAVRALAFALGDQVQVSLNLVQPFSFGPEAARDAVAARADVARAELVGLVPQALLELIPERRWPLLDLAEDRTIESRLRRTGFMSSE
ncbi:MAG TPA: hypothetical protein VME46_01080, partial [Acidimicrobiales bacterium]|nr:hypothetical protein [Acidimicrobiales bacterium]